jgi:aconitate hydratase
MGNQNAFGSLQNLETQQGTVQYYRLDQLEKEKVGPVSQLPVSIKILLEAALRNLDGFEVQEEDVRALANWKPKLESVKECPFKPYRVLLQDFTGVPCVVDLAALRSAMKRLKGNPATINPQNRVDLVIDHSVQVDSFGKANSLALNMDIEFKRNAERYEFLKWGSQSLKNFGVVPPGRGIVHQVNLEYLASVVGTQSSGGKTLAFPDTVVGTDSHTTMINGLGVLGWGVGGIEAEGVMLGQPVYMVIPEVVGFKLFGTLPEGATATDLVLRIVEILRKRNVVEKFVEFYGPGLAHLSLADRATIANMAPEYGATMGFFPVDQETLVYLRRTGRSEKAVDLVERYCKAQGLFWTPASPIPQFSENVELDLSTVVPALAGPKRPQDLIPLDVLKKTWEKSLRAPVKERGFALNETQLQKKIAVNGSTLTHGSVVIAAITSCTNTSNPSVMIGAGLLAKKAVEKGLSVKSYVKTSLAPGFASGYRIF